MYEFKMDLFDRGKSEKFFLFVQNSKEMLYESGTIIANEDLPYLCTLLCGESICQFDNLCAWFGSMTMAHFNQVILSLGSYFPPLNALSKKNHKMHHIMSNQHKIKVTCYAASMIDINEYLAEFIGSEASEKLVNHIWTKSYLTVCLMDVPRTHMYRVFFV